MTAETFGEDCVWGVRLVICSAGLFWLVLDDEKCEHVFN